MRSLLWPEGCRRSKTLQAGWIFTNKKVDYLSNHLCMAASSPYIWPDTVSESKHMDQENKNESINNCFFLGSCTKICHKVIFMAWRVHCKCLLGIQGDNEVFLQYGSSREKIWSKNQIDLSSFWSLSWGPFYGLRGAEDQRACKLGGYLPIKRLTIFPTIYVWQLALSVSQNTWCFSSFQKDNIMLRIWLLPLSDVNWESSRNFESLLFTFCCFRKEQGIWNLNIIL